MLCRYLMWVDEADVVIIYDSAPGKVMIALRCCAVIMFVFSVFRSVKRYPEKKPFYIPFVIVYSTWLLASVSNSFFSLHAVKPMLNCLCESLKILKIFDNLEDKIFDNL